MTTTTRKKTAEAKPIQGEATKLKNMPDVPWTMRLPDGRTLVVAVPGKWTTRDRGGELAFTPDGVRFLDRVQVLADADARQPSPGFIRTLREALGLSQQELADALGVAKMTIARWEWGQLVPRAKAVAALRALRRKSLKRGVVLAS